MAPKLALLLDNDLRRLKRDQGWERPVEGKGRGRRGWEPGEPAYACCFEPGAGLFLATMTLVETLAMATALGKEVRRPKSNLCLESGS